MSALDKLDTNSLLIDNLQDYNLCPLSEGIERARRLISDKAGIISKVEFEKLEPGEPAVYFARSQPANLFPLCGQQAKNFGDAVSVNADRAVMKAIGESIERYCSAQYDKDSFDFGNLSQINGPTVEPEKFALFSENQYCEKGFPFSPFTSETPLYWTPGYSLIQNKKVYVPSQMVYVPYDFSHTKEPPIYNPVSTGLACSSNLASAICKGILEVMERDAFMITWKNQLSCPLLDFENAKDPFIKQLLEAIDGTPVQFEARVLSLEFGVYVVIFIIRSASQHPPHTVMGLGADLDPERALILAMEEAYLTFLGMSRYIKSKPDFKPEPNFQDINTPTLHALAHAIDPDLQKSIEFLVSEKSRVSIGDLKNKSNKSALENVKTLTSIIEAMGLDIILFDLTTSDIDDAGFKVVRAIIPGMQPLDISHTQRYMGGKRLYELPSQWGMVGASKNENTLNPYPHPFP